MSILAAAKLLRKCQRRPLTLSLTYQVCYFDMNVSDRKKKKVLWKRSMDCGRRSTAVVKRHISQKGADRFAKQKSERRSMEWKEPDWEHGCIQQGSPQEDLSFLGDCLSGPWESHICCIFSNSW